MSRIQRIGVVLFLIGLFPFNRAMALEKPDVTYKIFQFPANMIPRIDGNDDDWSMVPDSYWIGMDQMVNDNDKTVKPDPKRFDARVKVGWVKGDSKLYFLYEATKSYWDFSLPSLHNDTFEIVVDADRSGGPFIAEQHPDVATLGKWNLYMSFQNTHAQNYHIFTPAQDKDWCMVWGPQSWLKELPYANAAYKYDFKPGEAGKLTLEFFVTPFNFASADGAAKSTISTLTENQVIGLCWAFIDYGDVTSTKNKYFWNLSDQHTMYGNASQLCQFKLMPLEDQFKKPIAAHWSFKVVDMDRRLVAFKDESEGNPTSWHWDFGDGTTSDEQHPIHTYKNPGAYVVVLDIVGAAGKSRLSKVWDVVVK